MITSAEEATRIAKAYNKERAQKYLPQILELVEKAASSGQRSVELPKEVSQEWACVDGALTEMGFNVHIPKDEFGFVRYFLISW